nr:uncharacterized protein LOC109149986 [Ipomoea batatas]
MVLGPSGKTRGVPSVQVEYLINIVEIKPWPPSQSLKTPKAVVIQWEHGEKNSGSTNQVAPMLETESGVGNGRIEFNESFRVPVTLLREISSKSVNGDTFQKNCIEFNLYEPRRDTTVKGQLLGTAIIDFANYGVVKEGLNVSVPINCKRSYRNTVQPLLCLKIQTVGKGRTKPLVRNNVRRESSMDSSVGESVSALVSEEYTEEAETASYTDDDVSSHSSLVNSSSAVESNCSSPHQKENGSEGGKNRRAEAENNHVLGSEQKIKNLDKKLVAEPVLSLNASSSSSPSTALSSDLEWISKKIGARNNIKSSTSFEKDSTMECNPNTNVKTNTGEQAEGVDSVVINCENGSQNHSHQRTEESICDGSLLNIDDNRNSNNSDGHIVKADIDESFSTSSNGIQEDARTGATDNGLAEGENTDSHQGNTQELVTERDKHQETGEGKELIIEKGQCSEGEPVNSCLQDNTTKQHLEGNSAIVAGRESFGAKTTCDERLNHVSSVHTLGESNRANGSVRSNQFVLRDKRNSIEGITSNDWKDTKVRSKETTNVVLERKCQELEQKVQMLEGELREAAAVEIGLFSVVAEHGSSTNKVHAPARRLSRLYFHACKENSVLRRLSAARSVVSGLILVAKACGNDVPRLTFWLSNCVLLRAAICKFSEKQQLPLSSEYSKNAVVNNERKPSPLKWQSFPNKKSVGNDLPGTFEDWENPLGFTKALEKVEAWIFSRIIESIWWQTFTPHMQSGAATSLDSEISKIYQRTSSSCSEEPENFSLELWKKAFRDAYERICPVRAGGHECGCLHLLSKLIMQQCVARLDVAMFNAILRESADDIPTDPVSDPISNPKVLPIPAGKASFAAGAQLKNAIGNWSRWLADLFGIDDDDEDEDLVEDDENTVDNSNGHERKGKDACLKPFYLLNAMSDLMMLPKDMLLSRTVRKEVCPTFGLSLIRRVLNVFIPDEFCPDPIPNVVLEALNSEDHMEVEEESVVNFPCSAAPIVYTPPSAAALDGILGDISSSSSQLTRSRSSVLKKSYTSDDELDELDSPLNLITMENSKVTKPGDGSGNGNGVRYQLLREVWMSSE